MKSNLKYAIFLLLINCAAMRLVAQTPVRTGPASAEEIKKARATLDTNMNNLGAHKTYIYSLGISNPVVSEQYKAWIKKYPENVNIPLAV
ncbi:MAG: hypothetical protein ACXVBA_24210, partial [Mucilaginibacter sp.]